MRDVFVSGQSSDDKPRVFKKSAYMANILPLCSEALKNVKSAHTANILLPWPSKRKNSSLCCQVVNVPTTVFAGYSLCQGQATYTINKGNDQDKSKT